jgi:SpoVK/Ycf46/Vps4 family AAA+-type ATPase
MSSDELDDLIEACRGQPASAAILRAMIRAAREAADPSSAVDYLESVGIAVLEDEAAARLAAEFLVEQDNPKTALAWLAGSAPETKIARARVLASLGDKKQAAKIYREVTRDHPELAEGELDDALSVVQSADKDGGAEVIELYGNRQEDPETKDALSGLAPADRETVKFTDIGGLDNVKAQITRRIVLPFQKPSLFRKFRRKAGGGILLFGPPGCGKTMLARATAGECGAKFAVIRIPEILDRWYGESEKRLAEAFDEARTDRPTVLFFDEIEAVAGRRRFDSNNTHATLVSTFLSELDGVDSANDGVLVLAATNVPWAIDPAFRRPGRFDRVVFIPPPDKVARAEILKTHLRERPKRADLNFEAIAAKTSGFSGADLAGLVEAATDFAIDDSLDMADEIAPITQAHLSDALAEQKPTTTEWLTTARNYAKYANEGGLYDDVMAFLDKHAK